MDRRTNEHPREGSGAEPGTPGEAPIPSSALKPNDIPPRRHYTGAERLSVVQGFLARGGRLADFAITHGVSPASLRNWLNAYEVGGADALESKPNRRNESGHSRGHYGADERRRIVEAFKKSGLGQREFAQTWGVALKSLSTWLARCDKEGPKGLEPRPRGRRKADPRSLSPGVKAEITRTKERFPDFGMRKVRDFLRRFQGISVSANSVRKTLDEAGIAPLPLPSARKRRQKPMPPRRFERAEPNQLWQSDITSFLLTRHSTRVSFRPWARVPWIKDPKLRAEWGCCAPATANGRAPDRSQTIKNVVTRLKVISERTTCELSLLGQDSVLTTFCATS